MRHRQVCHETSSSVPIKHRELLYVQLPVLNWISAVRVVVRKAECRELKSQMKQYFILTSNPGFTQTDRQMWVLS